jgi:hypothetical protein
MLKRRKTFSAKQPRLSTPLLLIVLSVLFSVSQAAAAVVRLDFEDLPVGTSVKTQYSGRGLLFPNGAFIDADPAAHSGTQVLRSDDPSREFNPGPLVIKFTSGQSAVSFFASRTDTFPPDQTGVLRAFDGSGNRIAEDGPRIVTPNDFTTAFSVRLSTAAIFRVEFEVGIASFESIDDLEIDGDVAPPPPTTLPVVQITAPLNNAELDVVGPIAVTGTVSGERLLETATLKLVSRDPPESTSPPFTTFIPLAPTGSSTTRTFNLPLSGIPLGPIVLTVVAENEGGLKGSASVLFTNLPGPIRARFGSEGGPGALGDFRWGVIQGDCKVAVYDRLAICLSDGSTKLIIGDILTKWMSLRSIESGLTGQLGCPLAEERDVIGAKAQDFEKGRVYAGLATGTHFVPPVFVQALDGLGGETATGLPIADPANDLGGGVPTWLFQQFARPDQPGLPSTLEIKGTPPRLWVERQGDDLSLLAAAGLTLTDESPTIWKSFPCNDTVGPCDLSIPPSPTPLADPGSFCRGIICDRYPCPGVPQWKAVLGDYVLTPLSGIVQNSHRAAADNPLVHEYHGEPPGFPSDWNIFVRPFPAFSNLFAENTDTIELEVELYFVNYFFVNTDFPNRGELISTSGRWIIDCAHIPYNSEIHPPFAFALMQTEMFRGHPATRANIWLGGFYTGEPVEIDIFPPPRPSPTARLVLVKPFNSDAALDVSVDFSFISSTQVRARFTAATRLNPVTEEGEMKWLRGRGYLGKWMVYWTE